MAKIRGAKGAKSNLVKKYNTKHPRKISYLDLCWMFPMLLALNLLLILLKDRLNDDEVEDDGDTEESDSGGDSDSEVWRKEDVSEKCPES